MAPWPEQGNEPKAPDKTCAKGGEHSPPEAVKVSPAGGDDVPVNATTSSFDEKQVEERNPDLSNLDDGQLRALLDEAITYKCPKDREGKSHLFRELLQEAEADETECTDSRRGGLGGAAAGGSRYYSNSSRRRGRRDTAVSERQTRGGSLQNLVHASNSEFDATFGYFVGGTGHGGRRKSKRSGTAAGGSSVGGGRDGAVNVSARQREGGSLPSNVNVGGMLTLGGLDYHHPPASLPFEDIRFCTKQSAVSSVKRKESFGHSSLSSNDFSSMPVHVSTDVNSGASGETGARLSGGTRYLIHKPECMVIDLGNCVESDDDGVRNSISTEKRNGTEEEGTELEVLQRAELTARVANYTSRATLEVGLGDIAKKTVPPSMGGHDLPDAETMCDKGSSGIVNGMEQSPLQLPSSYNSVKCIMGSASNGARDDRSILCSGKGDIAKRTTTLEGSGKSMSAGVVHNMFSMQHVSVLSIPPNDWISNPQATDVNRLTFHGGAKDCTGESKNKALDENGNAVNRVESANSNSNERKGKQRKMKTNNDRNVIMSQNIEGHRGDKDIESLIKFIESNSEGKGKPTKNATSHSNGPVNFGSKQQRNSSSAMAGSGTRPRRDRGGDELAADEDRSAGGKGRGAAKQVAKEHRGKGSKLKKSNSLEEISKTKLEDLTSSKTEGSLGGGATTDEAGGSLSSSLLLRRAKKQSALDDGELFEKARVGDRRSWGTEEGQQYYCTDGVTVSADESSSGSVPGANRKRRGLDERRRSERDDGIPPPLVAGEETEFHVVTKKQRRKKRRSSSGGRGPLSSGSVPVYNSHVAPSPAPYYQNRESSGGSGGGSSYYQRKAFSGASGGFPPHDRTVEREGGGVMLYQYRHHRPRSPDHLRRKSTSSMPPSDKSDSSDLDSVHSLPVSSTTPKLTLDQTSTSSGSTPQASYADIARMASTNVGPQTSQSHCGLTPGRWPAVTAPKGLPVPPPLPPPGGAAVAANATNPQFITGPKLNIGVPPVSGSKVTLNNPSSHSVVPLSSSAEDASSIGPRELDAPRAPGVSETPARQRLPVPSDFRTKKDAMTNTTLDYKLIPPHTGEDLEANARIGVVRTDRPPTMLLDVDYPPLDESLVSDKSDRKPAKSSSQVHNTLFPNTGISDACSAPSEAGNVLRQQTTESDIASDSREGPDLAVTVKHSQCSEPVVSAGASENVNMNRPRDTALGKLWSSGKKSGLSGNRPPVIILDETEQETVYGDGIATTSELTFGFEVNEQLLLLSDIGEDVAPALALKDSTSDECVSTAAESPASITSPGLTATTAAPSSAGDDFSARYREPTTQADNHDKIVTFVALAWDDVVKEMSCTAVCTGSKVQYYSGQ